jgi:hypothetical protein
MNSKWNLLSRTARPRVYLSMRIFPPRNPLLVHSSLDPITNNLPAGCVTRDPRKVERKKAGHVKARKMPTWVKR